MNKGDAVKFKNPIGDEIHEVFTILEDLDNRVLVQLNCEMTIKPTFIYLKNDLTIVFN
jgi:hypothetical protein